MGVGSAYARLLFNCVPLRKGSHLKSWRIPSSDTGGQINLKLVQKFNECRLQELLGLALGHPLPFKSDPRLKLNTFNLPPPKIPPRKYFNISQENLRWHTFQERICNSLMNYRHTLLRALQNRRSRGTRIKNQN